MKKFLLLMAGVLMISGAAFAADNGTNLKAEGAKEIEKVDVKVVVEKYADLEVTADKPVTFANLTQPGATDEKTVDYRVESNCAVILTASDVEFTGVNEEILSLDALVGDANPENGIEYGVGAVDKVMTLKASLTDREDSNEKGNWYDLEAGEKTGTITLTVAAK